MKIAGTLSCLICKEVFCRTGKDNGLMDFMSKPVGGIRTSVLGAFLCLLSPQRCFNK